jgi:hypothetical protein
VSDDSKIVALENAKADHAVKALLRQAKVLATEYYRLTGKPLGVTGEVAEYEAAEKLGLVLAGARSPYFDAVRYLPSRQERFQIKGRAVSREDRYRGRVSKIKCDGDFDAVLLVLLDKATFDVIEIWQAEREKVKVRLEEPGSKARNERGSLAISQFKSISEKVWPLTAS